MRTKKKIDPVPPPVAIRVSQGTSAGEGAHLSGVLKLTTQASPRCPAIVGLEPALWVVERVETVQETFNFKPGPLNSQVIPPQGSSFSILRHHCSTSSNLQGALSALFYNSDRPTCHHQR